jgi:hypothetical protein
MKHVVSISGGSASAVCADRVIKRFGLDDVTLFFCDTLFEDEDLYRFLEDLENYWEKQIVRYTDGRNPLQVAEDRKIIPNSMIAPCSYELKQRPFKEYITDLDKPLTVHLGLDWSETHRHDKPRKVYEEIDGVTVEFPLMWKPLPLMSYNRTIKDDWGIDPPRLYSFGFPHNNCGGRCVRAGSSEFLRLAKFFPERFDQMKEWERQQRDKGGPRSNRSILKKTVDGVPQPLTLAELQSDNATDQIPMFEESGDHFGCFCAY